MRQFVLIAGIVGVLMYGALASQKGIPALAAPHEVGASVPASSLAALQMSLEATGASLGEAVITGWAAVSETGARDRIAGSMGWKGSAPANEVRTVGIRTLENRTYVSVRWVLRADAAVRWQESARAMQAALQKTAGSASIIVQLEGLTKSEGLTAVAAKALSAVNATERQPWSDQRAASVAGRTTHLPPGPIGINIQVAARRDSARGETRVWVAWPALLQEY